MVGVGVIVVDSAAAAAAAMMMNVVSSFRLVVLSVILECTAYAFSIKSVEAANKSAETHKERPLLRNFGRQLQQRIVNSKQGPHRFGLEGAYTSDETCKLV